MSTDEIFHGIGRYRAGRGVITGHGWGRGMNWETGLDT